MIVLQISAQSLRERSLPSHAGRRPAPKESFETRRAAKQPNILEIRFGMSLAGSSCHLLSDRTSIRDHSSGCWHKLGSPYLILRKLNGLPASSYSGQMMSGEAQGRGEHSGQRAPCYAFENVSSIQVRYHV